MGNIFYFGRDRDKVIDSIKEAIGFIKIFSIINAIGSVLVFISMQYLFLVGSIVLTIATDSNDFSANLPTGLVIIILAFFVVSILMFFWCRRSQNSVISESKISYLPLSLNIFLLLGIIVLFVINEIINYWIFIFILELIINAVVLRQVYIYNDINN